MARGWESKSVESQIDSAEEKRPRNAKEGPTPEQLARNSERESLLLSRKRVMHDLGSATHERYRESLQAALKHLDEKIAELE